MNSFAKWAIAAAAVVVVAIAGFNLFPSRGSIVGQPTASPSVAAAASPSPAASSKVGAVCTPTPVKFDPSAKVDLTGAWAGNDAGIYYVRQLDNVIWWNGMSDRNTPPEMLGRGWNNVGRGEIKDDLTIVAEWADVPRGQVDGRGTVTFRIGADNDGNLVISKIAETGTGRGDSAWSRCQPGFPS
ncbi:MAG TPA: hypothetical protein VFM38_07650 [Candidatus Limnocylindrales bacterium]|nr:hypothetical protein [Candidatus Limnocylindrales bacterium]